LKSYRIGQKAGRVGFDWSAPDEILLKVQEEIEELREALDEGPPEKVREELGDVLFVLAQLGRKLEMEPEETLQAANEKFLRRFRGLEERLRASGKAWDEVGLEELERLWEQAKRDDEGPR
jgi:uncharacterized protein YabN with tetrapyrrole methylase and pyrophosphatase domain